MLSNLEEMSEGWSLFIVGHYSRLKRANWMKNQWNRVNLLNGKSVTSYGSKRSELDGLRVFSHYGKSLNMIRHEIDPYKGLQLGLNWFFKSDWTWNSTFKIPTLQPWYQQCRELYNLILFAMERFHKNFTIFQER